VKATPIEIIPYERRDILGKEYQGGSLSIGPDLFGSVFSSFDLF